MTFNLNYQIGFGRIYSCFASFLDVCSDDYRAHTSCITEAERYEGHLAKKKTSKKRNPQEEWMDILDSSIEKAPLYLKSYMQTMSGLDNIPRKEKQFRNFTSNSLNLRGAKESIVGEIWVLLKTEREKRQAEREEQQRKEKESKEKEKAPTPAPEKVATPSEESESKSGKESEIDVKTVHKAMRKALKKAPNKSMKLKDLRKIIEKKLGLPSSANKRLKKMLQAAPESSKKSKVKVDGKVIMLISR